MTKKREQTEKKKPPVEPLKKPSAATVNLKRPAAAMAAKHPPCPGKKRFDPIAYGPCTIYFMPGGYRLKLEKGSRQTIQIRYNKSTPLEAWSAVLARADEDA